VKVSDDMVSLARLAWAGEPLRREEHFSVYGLPPGWLDRFALVVFELGQDFPDDWRMTDIEIPLNLDGHRARLMSREQALTMTI
jgi:hypothetical protein